MGEEEEKGTPLSLLKSQDMAKIIFFFALVHEKLSLCRVENVILTKELIIVIFVKLPGSHLMNLN